MSTVIENALTIEEIEAEARRVQEEAQRRLEELEAQRKAIEETERAALYDRLNELMEAKEKLEADIETIQTRLNPHRGSVTKTGKRRGRPKGSKNKPKNVTPETPVVEPETNDDTVVEGVTEVEPEAVQEVEEVRPEVKIPEVVEEKTIDNYIEQVLLANKGVKFNEQELAEAIEAAGYTPPDKKNLFNLVYTVMFQYFKNNDEETSLISRSHGPQGRQYFIS